MLYKPISLTMGINTQYTMVGIIHWEKEGQEMFDYKFKTRDLEIHEFVSRKKKGFTFTI